MSTIITIILVFAIIGAALGFFSSGGDGDEAMAGAAGGAMMAGGCLFQLLISGIMIFLAITVFMWVFG